MDGKKKGSRTASAALVDDVAAQRPNLDILMEAIATLTRLPDFFLIDVLMHVKRAREVCKAWEFFLRSVFHEKIKMRVDLFFELGIRYQYDIHQDAVVLSDLYPSVTGIYTPRWPLLLRGVGLGFQLVEKKFFTEEELRSRCRALAERVFQEKYARDSKLFGHCMTLLCETIPFITNADEPKFSTMRIAYPNVWSFVYPFRSPSDVTHSFSSKELTLVARKTCMPESLLQTALDRVLATCKCSDPENLAISLACVGLPLRLVNKYRNAGKLTHDGSISLKDQSDRVHLQHIDPCYLLEAKKTFVSFVEFAACRALPAAMDYETAKWMLTRGKMGSYAQRALLKRVLKSIGSAQRENGFSAIGYNLEHIPVSEKHAISLLKTRYGWKFCARFLCDAASRRNDFEIQARVVVAVRRLESDEKRELADYLLASTPNTMSMMMRCLIGASQSGWQIFEDCLEMFRIENKEQLRALDWKKLRENILPPTPMPWRGKIKWLLMLYPDAGRRDVKMQSCTWLKTKTL